VFSGVGALAGNGSELNVGYKGEPGRAEGELVSGTFFSTLGVEPILGRALIPDCKRSGGLRLIASCLPNCAPRGTKTNRECPIVKKNTVQIPQLTASAANASGFLLASSSKTPRVKLVFLETFVPRRFRSRLATTLTLGLLPACLSYEDIRTCVAACGLSIMFT